MRVLVTGGAGFIGSHAVDRLLDRGDTVLVVDDLSSGKESNLNRRAEFVRMEIGSPELAGVATRFRPDAIIHLAAQASVVVSMAKPLLDATVNIVGGINLSDVAQAAGVTQFVYINTGGALYGSPEYLPVDEDHPIRPTSGYGLSKHTAELYFRLLLPSTIALKVLRLANVYGPRQDPYGEAGVVGIFGARMVRNEPVTIYGDGEQTRDFIYVADVVDAIIKAVDAPEPLTVNISLGEPTSVNEIYRMLVQVSGYTRPAIYAPERPGEVKHSVLANARAREVLGWTPRTSVQDGLRQTMEWVATDEVVTAGGEQRRDH